MDTDLHSCPFCDTVDPLRYRRTRRIAWFVLLCLGGILGLAALMLG